MKPNYVINNRTVMVTGVYNEWGKLYSKVIEGKNTFLVSQSPIAIMDSTLLQLGSDFHGSRRSSKHLLPPMRMHPITINAEQGIYFFPTKSIKKNDCIWFSQVHVKGTSPAGIRKTIVNTSFGHTIEIDMQESAFNNKLIRANQLNKIISENSKCMVNFCLEPKKSFYLSRDHTKNNFNIEKK